MLPSSFVGISGRRKPGAGGFPPPACSLVGVQCARNCRTLQHCARINQVRENAVRLEHDVKCEHAMPARYDPVPHFLCLLTRLHTLGTILEQLERHGRLSPPCRLQLLSEALERFKPFLCFPLSSRHVRQFPFPLPPNPWRSRTRLLRHRP